MEIKKIELISVQFTMCPPEDGTETEQRLSISRTGEISLTGYNFYSYDMKKGRTKKLYIGKERAERLLSYLEASEAPAIYTSDLGTWELSIYYDDGSSRNLTYSLSGDVFSRGINMTWALRYELDMPDLLGFGDRFFEDILAEEDEDSDFDFSNPDF